MILESRTKEQGKSTWLEDLDDSKLVGFGVDTLEHIAVLAPADLLHHLVSLHEMVAE